MSNPKVQLHISNHGVITLELDQDKAPKSVGNFLSYVAKGHYDGTIFHRIIPGFMAQGGGFEPGMKQKSTDQPIENEANNGLKNVHYSVAMARTSDPHSASSQFFINTTDNGFLNHTSPSPSGWGYAVFGKVVEGMDIVDKLEAVKTGKSGFHSDVPKEDVVIEKAVLVGGSGEKTVAKAVAAKTPAEAKAPAAKKEVPKKTATQKVPAKKSAE